jgi:hypothetical protein
MVPPKKFYKKKQPQALLPMAAGIKNKTATGECTVAVVRLRCV